MNILLRLALLCLLCLPGLARADQALLGRYLAEVPAAELMDGAEGFGPPREDIPVAPILRDGETIGWAFVNSSFVGTTGYSGKPIHILVALDPQAVVQGVRRSSIPNPSC